MDYPFNELAFRPQVEDCTANSMTSIKSCGIQYQRRSFAVRLNQWELGNSL